ncbi:MAG TPA: response regulator [Silvibacterium sp.]|nr:response regulator [Silvibacterium sp.]
MQTQFWLGSTEVPPPGFPFDRLVALKSQKPELTILIVDDEPIIADTLCAILGENGFTAHKAYNAKDGLRLAETLRPAIVLSDVLMPAMSGIQMAIRIKHLMPETRIVLLSGQAATAELMRRATDDGHNFELLGKPIHPTDLIATLKRQQ